MRVLVTGGGGFLGFAIVRELTRRGHTVTSFSRSSYAKLDEAHVRSIQGDLGDARAVADATENQDAVIHTAAKAGVWGNRDEYVRTNVVGTENVVAASLHAGIRRLVFTSSPSVCFDGKSHVRALNDLPYSKRYLCAYPETKATAEQHVLASNGRAGLATCALRPHLIFGPGDPHLVPRILDRARKRKLAIVGDGQNEVSLTYVDNAAAAHVDALEALEPDAAHAGRAYFLGQRETVRLWDWVGELLARVGIAPIARRIPRGLAYGGGALCELVWKALRRSGEPPMTRFVAAQLASSHSYDLEPAIRDFGYRERIGLAEANQRLYAALASGSLQS